MNAQLLSLTDRYLSFISEHHPVSATFLGLHSRDDTLGDLSGSAIKSSRDAMARLLADLDALDIEPCVGGGESVVGTTADRVDAEVLRSALRGGIFRYDVLRSHELDPGYYVGTALYGCNQLLMRDFAPIAERVALFTSRLRDVPRVLEACERNVADPPTVFATVAAEMARGGVRLLSEVGPRLSREVPPAAGALEEASSNASRAFTEAAERFDELAESSETPFHVGREAYDWLTREIHLLDLDAAQIVEIGRRAVEETTRAMERVAAEIDPSSDWRQVMERLQRNHPDAGGLRACYASEMARARDFVIEHGLVTIPTGESLKVVDTPTFLRTVLPYAAYGPPGPFEEEQRGLFYVTPVDASASADEQERQLMGHWVDNIRVIALHEGYPGHHLQLVRANRVPSKTRKLAGSNLFIEGWALYCEEMMREAGFFSDAPTRLCQLGATLWRAARIVVDVGLQCGGMSLKEAAEYMISRAALRPDKAAAEVKRYASHPTQPSSYLLGKRAIMSIRDRYEASAGAKFDLREFHDRLLDLGSVPPSLAEFELRPDASAPGGTR